MALTVIQRPRQELFSSANPTPYDNPFYISTWNASALPIVYKLESDLFPTNYVDGVDTFNSITNYNGYAQFNLIGTYNTYSVGDFIKITNSLNATYNGIWQITFITDANSYVINTRFIGDSLGDVQKYYQNYPADGLLNYRKGE